MTVRHTQKHKKSDSCLQNIPKFTISYNFILCYPSIRLFYFFTTYLNPWNSPVLYLLVGKGPGSSSSKIGSPVNLSMASRKG